MTRLPLVCEKLALLDRHLPHLLGELAQAIARRRLSNLAVAQTLELDRVIAKGVVLSVDPELGLDPLDACCDGALAGRRGARAAAFIDLAAEFDAPVGVGDRVALDVDERLREDTAGTWAQNVGTAMSAEGTVGARASGEQVNGLSTRLCSASVVTRLGARGGYGSFLWLNMDS